MKSQTNQHTDHQHVSLRHNIPFLCIVCISPAAYAGVGSAPEWPDWETSQTELETVSGWCVTSLTVWLAASPFAV